MTSARSFQLAAKAQLGQHDEEYPPIEFPMIDAEGNTTPIVAHYPGDAAFTVLMSLLGTDEVQGTEEAQVFFSFIRKVFSPDDFAFIRTRLQSEELTLDMLLELLGEMVETWTSFPTEQPSGSTPSRPSTGTRSTGRAPGKGSTQRSSLPVGS